jgi:hypothetical protein
MYSKIALVGLFCVACASAAPTIALAAFPAVTLGVGTTTGVLSAAQVTVAAAAIAGLAIAKEALFLASAADARGKRSTTEVDFSDMFESIEAKDPADCAKLLVCEAFAKPDSEINGEELAIRGLFDDLSLIQPNAFGKFQLAAYMGIHKDQAVCRQTYTKCPISVTALSNLLNVQ